MTHGLLPVGFAGGEEIGECDGGLRWGGPAAGSITRAKGKQFPHARLPWRPKNHHCISRVTALTKNLRPRNEVCPTADAGWCSAIAMGVAVHVKFFICDLTPLQHAEHRDQCIALWFGDFKVAGRHEISC